MNKNNGMDQEEDDGKDEDDDDEEMTRRSTASKPHNHQHQTHSDPQSDGNTNHASHPRVTALMPQGRTRDRNAALERPLAKAHLEHLLNLGANRQVR